MSSLLRIPYTAARLGVSLALLPPRLVWRLFQGGAEQVSPEPSEPVVVVPPVPPAPPKPVVVVPPVPPVVDLSAPPAGPEAERLGDAPLHVDRDATVAGSFGPAQDPQANIAVAPPWEGYDQQPAAEIVRRLAAADAAVKAVAALYERGHKGRRSVLAAAAG